MAATISARARRASSCRAGRSARASEDQHQRALRPRLRRAVRRPAGLAASSLSSVLARSSPGVHQRARSPAMSPRSRRGCARPPHLETPCEPYGLAAVVVGTGSTPGDPCHGVSWVRAPGSPDEVESNRTHRLRRRGVVPGRARAVGARLARQRRCAAGRAHRARPDTGGAVGRVGGSGAVGRPPVPPVPPDSASDAAAAPSAVARNIRPATTPAASAPTRNVPGRRRASRARRRVRPGSRFSRRLPKARTRSETSWARSVARPCDGPCPGAICCRSSPSVARSATACPGRWWPGRSAAGDLPLRFADDVAGLFGRGPGDVERLVLRGPATCLPWSAAVDAVPWPCRGARGSGSIYGGARAVAGHESAAGAGGRYQGRWGSCRCCSTGHFP